MEHNLSIIGMFLEHIMGYFKSITGTSLLYEQVDILISNNQTL